MTRAVIALSLLALALPASAGVRMEFKDTETGDPAPVVSKAFAGTDRLRMETQGQVMIFRGDKQVLWVVDPAEGTYMELTKEGMGGRMAEAMKEMQAQMASMPPEQRAMVEAMMKQQMGGAMPGAAKPAPPAPLTWTANGKADVVAGHACKGYDGARGGKVEEWICATDWTTFGLTENDFSAFQAFAKFMEEMSGPMRNMADQMKGKVVDPTMPGVPLRMVSKTARGEFTHEITLLEKADVAGSLFELPAGVKKQDMGGGDDEEADEAPAHPARGRK